MNGELLLQEARGMSRSLLRRDIIFTDMLSSALI